MRNSDPYVSYRLYLEQSDNLEFPHESVEPRALGSLTSIRLHATNNHECREWLLDSTYRTNSSRVELSMIIVKIFGAGFPLARLFFEGSRNDFQGKTRRVDVITSFLYSLQQRVSYLTPKFFFTDNDSGQIAVIGSLYQIELSIFLWHLKRAVWAKALSLKKNDALKITDTEYNHLQMQITRQYCMYPMFFGGNSLQNLQ